VGIFGNFFSSGSKSYDKYGDILKKMLTTKEQRLEAMQTLQSLPVHQCVPQLLKRFEMVLDSGLQDTKEKEQCLNIIVSFGQASQPFVSEFLANQRRISWPIKIAEKIFSYDEYVDLLLKNLNADIAVFDEAALERNEEILLALKEVKGKENDIVNKVTSFLSSRDENVRIAALECLEEQAIESLQAQKIILDLSLIPLTDENSRFLGIVKTIIQNHKWI
jgi:hypothetical protein